MENTSEHLNFGPKGKFSHCILNCHYVKMQKLNEFTLFQMTLTTLEFAFWRIALPHSHWSYMVLRCCGWRVAFIILTILHDICAHKLIRTMCLTWFLHLSIDQKFSEQITQALIYIWLLLLCADLLHKEHVGPATAFLNVWVFINFIFANKQTWQSGSIHACH